MASFRVERLALVGSLALLPVLAYVVAGAAIAAPTVVCVLVIAYSLHRLFGPSEAAEAAEGAAGH